MNGYVLLGRMPMLELRSASHINEYMRYCTMDKFSDIYYNDIKFNSRDLDNKQKKINKLSRKYDFHFVRAELNLETKQHFMSLPSPKFWHGAYDLEIYKQADAIVAITPQHKKRLCEVPNYFNYKKKIINKDWMPPERVILFRQALDECFFKNVDIINKKNFTIGFTGYVGRRRSPYEILKVFSFLDRKCSRKIKWKLNYFGKKCQYNTESFARTEAALWKRYVSPRSVRYEEMPDMLCNFDVFIDSGISSRADFNGRLGLLEAAACGVPIICGDFETRKVLFGRDYPLMWNNKLKFNSIEKRQKIIEFILKLQSDIKFRLEMSKHVQMCARKHHIDIVSKEYEEQIRHVVG